MYTNCAITHNRRVFTHLSICIELLPTCPKHIIAEVQNMTPTQINNFTENRSSSPMTVIAPIITAINKTSRSSLNILQFSQHKMLALRTFFIFLNTYQPHVLQPDVSNITQELRSCPSAHSMLDCINVSHWAVDGAAKLLVDGRRDHGLFMSRSDDYSHRLVHDLITVVKKATLNLNLLSIIEPRLISIGLALWDHPIQKVTARLTLRRDKHDCKESENTRQNQEKQLLHWDKPFSSK